MPDLTLGIGTAISGIGALFGGSAEQRAAEQQAQLSRESLALQERIYEEQQALLQPYVAAGTDIGLPGLTGLTTPEGQAAFLEQYYTSPQFQVLEQQASGAELARAAVEGTLGGSATANQLQRIAPGLGLQALEQQYGQYAQLAGIGQAAAAGTAQLGTQYGQTAANIYSQLGTAEAQAAAAYPGTFGTAFGQVGGYILGQGLEGLF